MNLNSFEKDIIKNILANEASNYPVLFEQFDRLVVLSRKYTGNGFFTDFDPNLNTNNPNLNIEFGLSVSAYTSNENELIGFVLFIRDGKISTLEGYVYEGTFPENINEYTIINK